MKGQKFNRHKQRPRKVYYTIPEVAKMVQMTQSDILHIIEYFKFNTSKPGKLQLGQVEIVIRIKALRGWDVGDVVTRDTRCYSEQMFHKIRRHFESLDK